MLKELTRGLGNLLAPGFCLACRGRTSRAEMPLCRSCRRSLMGLEPPAPSAFGPLETVWSCLPYSKSVRTCVKDLKYRGNLSLLPLIEDIVEKYVKDNGISGRDPCLVIPVPAHPFRRISRGIDHAALIAAALAKSIGSGTDRRTLLRVRHTPPQAELSRKDRLKNLRGAFKVCERNSVKGRNVILADDVITTGATLATCARELLKNGARSVSAFTLARSMKS